MMVVVILAAISMQALAGAGTFAPRQELNVSEAVIVRDLATIARRLEDGESATMPRSVRSGMLGPASVVLTPAEAAVVVDDDNGLAVLVEHGLPLDADIARHLVCLSVRHGSSGTLRYLQARVRQVDPGECRR